jgi:hypothetical protein
MFGGATAGVGTACGFGPAQPTSRATSRVWPEQLLLSALQRACAPADLLAGPLRRKEKGCTWGMALCLHHSMLSPCLLVFLLDPPKVPLPWLGLYQKFGGAPAMLGQDSRMIWNQVFSASPIRRRLQTAIGGVEAEVRERFLPKRRRRRGNLDRRIAVARAEQVVIEVLVRVHFGSPGRTRTHQAPYLPGAGCSSSL